MQARYYDPVIGRFYSNDPVGFSNVHNFNRYAYANNNPYKYVDPDGEAAHFALGAGYSAGAVFAQTAVVSYAIMKTIDLILPNPLDGIMMNESEEISDRSDQDGSSEQMDEFQDELDSISTPESEGKTVVRNLKPGVKVDELQDKAPGKTREDGRKNTAEGGNNGTHSSTRTKGNPKTLDVNRPKQKPRKYREHQ